MGRAKGVNQKAASALEKKAQHQEQVKQKEEARRQQEAAAEWSKGANERASKRQEDAAAKADEAARKRKEKAALLAEEEANFGAGGKTKKAPTLSQKKNKKKDELSLLEDALVGAADKKVKAKRQAEREKQQKLKEEEEARKQKVKEQPMDPLLANTEQMIAGTDDGLIGRQANVTSETQASGIDAALGSLDISGGAGTATPSRKALYKAFEERMMPALKEEYPNLKLSQYKDKVFQLWKKSPENPENQE